MQIFVIHFPELFNSRNYGYRLPTEIEWEYFAREGYNPSTNKFSGTDSENDMWNFGVNLKRTSFTPKVFEIKSLNANALGLFDVTGNVEEWCFDWYGSVTTDTALIGAETGMSRVSRGGSWKSTNKFCYVSYRSKINPYRRYDCVGFRVVRSLNQN